MGGQNKEPYGLRFIVLQNILNQKKVPQRLAHFFLIDGNKAVMQPVTDKRPAAGVGFRLSHFIFMMRKNQITAPAVKVKAVTQVL